MKQIKGTANLKQLILVFIIQIALTANSEIESSKKIILKGTEWTSDFSYYHNIYYFQTDSTGYSEDGQFLWSTPVDPALYNNSRDSIMYDEADPFKYSIRDTILTIKYLSEDHDSDNDHRIFYLQYDDSNNIFFMSDYMFTYGHELLFINK